MKSHPVPHPTTKRLLDHTLLSEEAEAALARRIQAGDEDARHELVRQNLRLAWAFARRYAGNPELYGDPEDLFAEGVLGLYKATRRFGTKPGRFAQYAIFYLRDALRTRRRFEGNRWFASSAERAMPGAVAWRWLERTGREADDELIAGALGWSQRRLRSTLGRARPISLELPIGEFGVTLAEIVPDEGIDGADVQVETNDRIAEVRRALDRLDSEQREVIQRRFGVLAEKPAASPEANARRTHRRIKKLEREALAQLRTILGGEGSEIALPASAERLVA